MTREALAALEQELSQIPQGKLWVQHPAAPPDDSPLPIRFQTQTDGRGTMAIYHPFPGAAVCLWSFLGSALQIRHDPLPSGLEITHCHLGRAGWSMGCGAEVYLGPGDLALHSLGCCNQSHLRFPLGAFQGITVLFDLEEFAGHCPQALRDAGLEPNQLRDTFCAHGELLAIPDDGQLSAIFDPLYRAPLSLRPAYCPLKVQELLLYLVQLGPDPSRILPCGTQQAQAIHSIHDLLTQNLSQRFTIEQLSHRYLINTSSLKALFKAVYGLPIATYMKEYRIHQAMRLLRESGQPISDIAAQVGYESPGKFSKAFRDVTGQLPTQYRRQHQPLIRPGASHPQWPGATG